MDDRAEIKCAHGLGDLCLFEADIVRYSFKRHEHDYYVVGIIEEGVQRFSCGPRRRCLTPPRGIVVINPGEAHTGEAALPSGFRYRALYPSPEALRALASELLGREAPLPDFPEPVIEDEGLFLLIRDLHDALSRPASALEQESLYLRVLARLVSRHSASLPSPSRPGEERGPIAKVRAFLEVHYATEVRLADLAALAALSPYYLVRAFRKEFGLPPHAYLASLRIRAAQRLLREGRNLAEVAYETGFSSQSHFTSTFKAIIGVPPGLYARAIS